MILSRRLPQRLRGFSLVEVAISLILLGLAASGVFAILTQQMEQHRIAETTDRLHKAQDALLSFVTGYGRLPCPAVATSKGVESIASVAAGITTCTTQSGFLPAVTLGMSDIDAWGLYEGAWHDGAGVPNGTYLRAIRYSVTSLAAPNSWDLTSVSLGAAATQPGQRAAVQTTIAANQGLFVCASITGITPVNNRCGSTANTLAGNVAVVLWSLGSDAPDLANYSLDELQNYNLTVARVVISRPYAPKGASNGQFDDQVAWIPYQVIADRLLSAGFVQ